MGKNDVRRYGPLRDKQRLEAALSELCGDAGRMHLVKEGRREIIQVNPALLGARL